MARERVRARLMPAVAIAGLFALVAGGAAARWTAPEPPRAPTALSPEVNVRLGAGGAGRGLRPTTAPAGLIVFASEQDGQHQIRTVRPDGSGLARVSLSGAQDFPGPVAGDGRRLLAVTSDDSPRSGHSERVWLLQPGSDGWSSRPIAGPSRWLRNPTWLPDGRGVVLESDQSGTVAVELHWVDGRAPERIASEPSGSFEPAVKPDGTALVFVSSRDGNPEIYRIDLGRSRALRRLTWSPGSDGSPQWTLDGSQLVYLSERGGAVRAYLVGQDGSHPRPLIGSNEPRDAPDDSFVAHRDLALSPDGRRVALVEQRASRSVLRIVRLSDGTLLSHDEGRWHDQTPCWAPDGRHIVFASDRTGDLELFVADADGRNAEQLTRSPGADWLPRWIELT